MNKKFLNEDGSLNVERINQLPIEEWLEVVGDMTKDEFAYLETHSHLSHGPTKAVVVNYTMEEEIERGTAVDADELLNNLREELKRKK